MKTKQTHQTQKMNQTAFGSTAINNKNKESTNSGNGAGNQSFTLPNDKSSANSKNNAAPKEGQSTR